jgi:putative transcriptional regulator
MADADDLHSGALLISPPMQQDPNFRRTVVLICEHGEKGSFGLTLNRIVDDIALDDLLEGPFAYDGPVGLGGPVQRDTLHFVHRMDDEAGGIDLGDGVRWGGDFDVIRERAQYGEATAQDLRFFLGYAGWGPGQIAAEIEQDGWILAESDAAAVFPDDPEALWRTTLRRMGGEYAMLANFPDDPRMN